MSQPLSPASRSALALLTTLAGIGAGLALWLGFGISLLLTRGDGLMNLLSWQRPALLAAAMLVALSWPVLWWRQANAVWRIPGSIAALLTVLAIVSLWALLGREALSASRAILSLGAAVCVGCIVTPMCIAPSLPIAGRPSPLSVPLQLALALLGGGGALFALLALKWPGHQMAAIPAPILMLLVAIASAVLLLWWHERGGLVPPQRYRWRWLILALVFLMPLAMAAVAFFWPQRAHIAWPSAALLIFVGIFLQNRLLLTETD